MSESTLRIGLIAPEVLGTYGDTGNALVLAERTRRRGINAEIVTIPLLAPIPDSLDLYSLGGGEDTAQMLAARHLKSDPGLTRAAERGTPILAICASLQILGSWYEDAAGARVDGLGLLDLTTGPQGRRAIGEILTEPLIDGLTDVLTGFENHGGATTLGEDARPLGKVLAGVGNGGPENQADQQYEGAVQGSIIGTYLHGPVLARNPQLADYLLEKAIGQPLTPLEMESVQRLRTERLARAR